MNKYYDIFRRNFPYVSREDKTVNKILDNHDNIIIEKRNKKEELIGVSIINKNTILMLCVEEKYRNKGIGTYLLNESEKIIKNNGYNEIKVGVGFDYLAPSVPTSKRYYDSENEKLYSGLNNNSSDFFEKRGYIHSWDCNCFDMFLPLKEFDKKDYSIGSVINGILYRWATKDDLNKIIKCVDDAEESFTKYYKNEKLYRKTNNQRVLIALKDDEVVGTLIVSKETEAKDLGCVGCTTVKHSCRGKHIGVNIVIVGTKYLKDIGLTNANLSYTYTGMDHMYGYSGYKISCYYMMARKKI